ncbi:MAG: AtpZ/AtpI family protein [Campylobacterales bacterium]
MSDPKYKSVITSLDQASLGISIVVAILIGVGLGMGMKSITGAGWTLWLGLFWGVAAAILNIYKAYKKQRAALEEEANRHQHTAQ